MGVTALMRDGVTALMRGELAFLTVVQCGSCRWETGRRRRREFNQRS